MAHSRMIPSDFYRQELNKSTWEVPTRYTNLSPIGFGAFGQVCSATETQTGMKVAIKKLSRPFQTDTDAKRAYREILMLKHMTHDNVISLLDTFTPAKSIDDFNDVYFVTQLVGTDLHNIIKNQDVSDDQVQFLVYQILCGVKYVHSAGIIHRDLKPSNIAVNEACELKILDFGLARMSDDKMTGYVATRWYRAPEIMLNWMHYNKTVDIWSVGCNMAELLNGKVLFRGTDYIDQLTRIIALIGMPSDALLAKITSVEARNFILSLPQKEKTDLKTYFQGANPLAIDLLERMLDLDPDTRISAEEAMAHPYLKKYADLSDEPVSEPYNQSFEDQTFDIPTWKRKVYDEVTSFTPCFIE